MASDMGVHVTQWSVTEFLHGEELAPTDIRQHLLNVDGDQAVNVSTVRWGMGCFSSGKSESPLLVQILMSKACKLECITDENAELMVMTVMKNIIL